MQIYYVFFEGEENRGGEESGIVCREVPDANKHTKRKGKGERYCCRGRGSWSWGCSRGSESSE